MNAQYQDRPHGGINFNETWSPYFSYEQWKIIFVCIYQSYNYSCIFLLRTKIHNNSNATWNRKRLRGFDKIPDYINIQLTQANATNSL